MFTEALMGVAQEILIVGGALCIIMLFFVLLRTFICVVKVSRLIGNVKSSYKQVVGLTQIPSVLIQKLLSDKE